MPNVVAIAILLPVNLSKLLDFFMLLRSCLCGIGLPGKPPSFVFWLWAALGASLVYYYFNRQINEGPKPSELDWVTFKRDILPYGRVRLATCYVTARAHILRFCRITFRRLKSMAVAKLPLFMSALSLELRSVAR